MRSIIMNRRTRDKNLHIEVPGGIINITIGLSDLDGRSVTCVSVNADGNRYAGSPEWWINGEPGNGGWGGRIIKTGK